MSRARKKVLLVQQAMNPPGGGISVAAWMAQTLVEDHDVTLLTWDAPRWDRTNRYYGTSLRGSDFGVVQVPRALRGARRFVPVPLALLERHMLMREARKISGHYDLVVSATNEFDIGRRMIQYIHFPWGYWPRPDVDLRWYHQGPGILPAYYALGRKIASVSREAIAANRTLVNSEWTGNKFVQKYGGTYDVLYPPITGAAEPKPWKQRSDAFIIAGRISPEKRLPDVMRIVGRVRERGFDVRLMIVTSQKKGRYEAAVEAMARDLPWVAVLYDLSREELLRRFASTKFGVHGMHDEHFGMAIAEMTRSGCIVFIHDSGGQAEIVREPRLRYSSDDDAVQKIVTLLRNPAQHREISARLAAESAKFSVDAFCTRFRAIVDEELEVAARPSEAESQLVGHR